MSQPYQSLRRLVARTMFRAQSGICPGCGQALPRKWGCTRLTFDHVWPISKVGAWDAFEGNVVLMHRKCNEAKSDRRPHPCEVLFLFAVNRRLGFEERETLLWDAAA